MKSAVLFLIAMLLFGCAPEHQPEPTGKPLIFVSIPPQAGLLRMMVDDHAEVRTLVDETQSPHSYEPTARQLTALGEADVLFTIGAPFEKALLKKIRPLYPDLPIMATGDQVIKRTMPHEHHGGDCTHDHGGKDPHIWLSAENALLIAASMVETLEQIDPDNQTFYQEKYKALHTTLEQLNDDMEEQLAPYHGSRFYVFHPSFGYFADRYGLQQVPIELDGKSPSPRQLAGLIERAQADRVKVIFVQKQFPADSANAVADAIGGEVVPLDPLAEDVVANLKQIAESIAQALEQ
jgi:zinc transport system substrate-binding protein